MSHAARCALERFSFFFRCTNHHCLRFLHLIKYLNYSYQEREFGSYINIPPHRQQQLALDDVCAVCTADLIHLETPDARYGHPQLSQSPLLFLPLQSVVKASLPHSALCFQDILKNL